MSPARLIHQSPVVLAALVLATLGCRTLAPPEGVRIHHVQGHDARSPLAGEQVRGVRGVVTAVDDGGDDRGFWMEDPEGDGDDATSEGIFVETRDLVAIGTAVEVDGRVEEAADPEREADLTVTRLRATDVRRVVGGTTLPPPTRLGRGGRRPPAAAIVDGIAFYESLEGMRVEVAGAVVVGPTTRHGDLVVVADGGADAGPRTRRGGLLLTPEDENPERLVIADRLLDRAPDVDVGDRFDGPITGVVDYGFGNYKILPAALPPIVRAAPVDETTTLTSSERQLTLATFNVYNLSARAAPAKLERLAKTLVRELGAPDVVALQEIQDDDGDVKSGRASATATYAALIAAVEAAGGPRYDVRQVDPIDGADGGQPGANIRVALLHDPARVDFVDRGRAGPLDATSVAVGPDGPRLTLSPGRVAARDPAFADSRKPLAGELLFRGRRLFVIVTHLTSKGGDDPLMGGRQPPRRPTETQRVRQARALHDFMESLLAADPEAYAVVLGDMNEMPFRPPMAALAGERWVNLMERLPPDERYTFVYEGNAQVLDHVLVSPALATRASPEVDVVHVHADRAHGRRASDHDPVVVRLTFEEEALMRMTFEEEP